MWIALLVLCGVWSGAFTQVDPDVESDPGGSIETPGCVRDDKCVCEFDAEWSQLSQYTALVNARTRIEELEAKVALMDYQYMYERMANITSHLESLERRIDSQSISLTMTELTEIRKAVEILVNLVGELQANGTLTKESEAIRLELTELEILVEDLWNRNPYGTNEELQHEIAELRNKLLECQNKFVSFNTSFFPGDSIPISQPVDRDWCDTHEIESIGDAVAHRWITASWGSWMKDPHPASDQNRSNIFYRNSNYNGYVFHNNYSDFVSDSRSEKFNSGNVYGVGYIVYNSTVYTPYGSLVYTYSLRNGAKGSITFSKDNYKYLGSSLNTFVDFKADEIGLWALYATDESKGKLVASLLDPETLREREVYFTNRHKSSACAAFMACGILYTLDECKSRLSPDEHVTQYLYNTKTRAEYYRPFHVPSKFGQILQLHYNARERMLFGWDNGHFVTYPIKWRTTGPAEALPVA